MVMRNTEQSRKALQGLFSARQTHPVIKLCGMTRTEDIQAINAAKPTFCGFIINVPKSKRSLTPAQQANLVTNLSASIFSVGVLVDEPIESAVSLAQSDCFDALQLHGNEDNSYIQAIKKQISIPIIQAFQIHEGFNFGIVENSLADMVLLDSGSGSGKPFAWNIVPQTIRPFFLAGGLTPQTIPQAIKHVHPWGLDLSSGIERNGYKDKEKIMEAVAAVKQTSPAR